MAEVVLELSILSAEGEAETELVWVEEHQGEGEREVVYATIRVGDTLAQRTFAGHTWRVRAKASQVLLMEVTAVDQPAVQQHAVGRVPAQDDASGATGAPAGADAVSMAASAVASDAADPSVATVEVGKWVAHDGEGHFERLPCVGAYPSRVFWREIDEEGNAAATYEQLEVRSDTRWLWWADPLFDAMGSVGGDGQQLLFSAMSVAAAYRLDTAYSWPAWARDIARLLGLGPNPIVACIIIVAILGAVVAAALPLTEQSLLLRKVSTPTHDVLLTKSSGLRRDPSDRPGYVNPWRHITAGGFAPTPADLRQAEQRRHHHVLFLAVVAVFVAARVRAVIVHVQDWPA